MNLNLPLPQELRNKLEEKSKSEPIYCIRSNISLTGEYTDRLYIGATENEVFIFENNEEKYIPISSITSANCRNMVNGGVLSVTVNNEELMLARCSMTDISRLACLAKGINWLCEGKTDKRVINRDREKYCAKCGISFQLNNQ